MENPILEQAAANDQTGWKTEEYHGRQMHVCAEQRAVENTELAGHGQQWSFTVRISETGVGAKDDKGASATSDPELFYSTQAVAEDMGFIRGRELIEAS